MTELQVFLTFLLNLPIYGGQQLDCKTLSARMRYSLSHQLPELLVNLLDALLLFDDAIVVGVNSGFLEFNSPTLSRYPQSVLPKFLFGLTSQVFDPVTGALLSNYSADSVEALLTGLRLLRRAKIQGFSSVSNHRAIEEFLQPQVAPIATVDRIVTKNMRTFWSLILDDVPIKLGFPGNGVTSDMKYPYVPSMSMVDPRFLPPLCRLVMERAISDFLPENYDLTSDCEYIKFYPYIPYPERIVTLSVVPKSFKVGRAITVTNTSSVILGATLRESLWAKCRKMGIERLVNVHDQSLSHESLINNPLDTFCRDIKGGSTCITVDQQRAYLSSNRTIVNLFNASIPSAVVGPEGVVDLRTLTMGDASCTALLTIDMLGLLVLAQTALNCGLREYTIEEIQEALAFLKYEDRVRCVGDDVLGPERLGSMFDYLATSLGIIINRRKSSDATSRHKETCGCWIIWDPQSLSYRRIFPFRAPDYTRDLVSDLATLARSYERTKKSKFSVAVFIAYASGLTHQLEYLENESYTVEKIGSPLGLRPSRRSVRLQPPTRFRVSDDIAYAFRCRESSVEPRMSRRPTMDRGRIVKSRDITREASTSTINRQEVHSAIHDSPISRSVSGLNCAHFALSLLFTSPARHLIDVR